MTPSHPYTDTLKISRHATDYEYEASVNYKFAYNTEYTRVFTDKSRRRRRRIANSLNDTMTRVLRSGTSVDWDR